MKRALSFCFALLAGVVAQAAVAADESPSGKNCADVRGIGKWRVKDPRTLFVNASQNRFMVVFSTECLGPSPSRLRIEARGACLAPGDLMTFSRARPRGGETAIDYRCVVDQVRRLYRLDDVETRPGERREAWESTFDCLPPAQCP